MTIPVMKQVLAQNSGVRIIFVSNRNWEALCRDIPGLTFFPADLKGTHKGINGLYRLFRAIRRAHDISAVADLHQVLRSQIVRTFFRLGGTPLAVIDKGRAGKKALTRKENKILQPLTTTIQRYAAVFRQLGLHCDMQGAIAYAPRLPLNDTITAVTGPREGVTWIGLAPFATYREKTYPPEKMQQVLAALVQRPHCRVLLFGGGATETAQLQAMASAHPEAVVMAGRFSLEDELVAISQLDVMLSMDSANMHLASLFGVPVVSVWGATHPFAGFMGYGQHMENAVQIMDLSCRPCSVFGNKPCFRGDHACMEWILPERIVERVLFVVGEHM